MERLFDDKDKFTATGLELDRQIRQATYSIIQEWAKRYSLRDINAIAQAAVNDNALELLLTSEHKEAVANASKK